MEFSREFFYDEVQDGFYVPALMKRAWGAELTVFSEFDRICKKYQLPYYATGGTLLSTVRDGKFIPWDDDIDVWMLRADYIAFCEIAKYELPEELLISSLETNINFKGSNPLLRTPVLCYNSTLLRKYNEYPYWVFLDIFPMDEISDNPKEEEYRRRLVFKLYSFWNLLLEGESSEKIEIALEELEERLHIRLERDNSLIGQIRRILDQIYQAYNTMKGEYISCMPWYYKENAKFPRQSLENPKRLPFCNVEMSVPGDFEGILRLLYGDYKKKVKAGGKHGYPYYKECEELLESSGQGRRIYWKYSFSDDDLIRPAVHSFREVVLKTADYLLASERRIYQQLIEKNPEACLMELSRCQEEAIAFGNAIEVKKGEGTESVSILEQYCETLYLSYQSLSKAVNREVGDTEPREKETDNNIEAEIEKKLKRQAYYLKKLRSALEKEFKKQVVFLPHSAKHFASLRPLIDALYAAGDVDCKIIPIPYLDRLGDGSLSDMHYEGAEFPKEYEITDYRTYDFAKELPDAIVINSPYDECNPVWTVDPFFYSKELKKYTNKLIYIPWFVTDEIDPKNEEDGKAFVNMDYYVTVPGIFHADLTIVQSKEMKKAYLAKISKFSNGDIRKRMNKKISGAGSCLLGDKEGQGTKEVVAKFRHFLGRK